MTTATVSFRGFQTTVVVDAYDEDISTNACTVEWHFEDMTPEDHADLHVSDEEEDAIVQQIHAVMYDARSDEID